MSHVMTNPIYTICKQQRRRLACLSEKSDQPYIILSIDSTLHCRLYTWKMWCRPVRVSPGRKPLKTGFLIRLTWEWYTRYVNYIRMIYEIYDNYIVDIWQMRHMISELWYLRYIIPKVNLSVFLLLSQRTIKMVSNNVSVTSLFMTSWRIISRCILPKAVIARYTTLRFTKIRHRALYYT